MSTMEEIASALSMIRNGIARLNSAFPQRKFTIDGRLVGDIGEIIAYLHYDINLDDVSQPIHDGTTSDGRRVQIKATFQDALTFKSTSDYYLGLKINDDGSFLEIYNGPGHLIRDSYSHRKGIGVKLLRFPNAKLEALSSMVDDSQRIPKRQCSGEQSLQIGK